MIIRSARARSGITLTEILISILIMAVGLISLATLFPLGLVRLRDAARQSRSALLTESAFADITSRKLLDKAAFSETYYPVDPFTIDPAYNLNVNPISNPGVPPSGGLPVCYDPLWFAATGYAPATATTTNGNFAARFPANTFNGVAAARFGFSTQLTNAAIGMQRITNFAPWCAATSNFPYTYAWPNSLSPAPTPKFFPITYPPGGNPTNFRDMVVDTFVSQEDVVMQNESENQQILQSSTPNLQQSASGVVPMMDGNNHTYTDWRYSWFFTGRQIDNLDDTQFAGDIVVVENRQLGAELVGRQQVASGEFVVEAIFGPGANKSGGVNAAGQYFAAGASRSVLLQWPSRLPDPEIKVGNWFADVTYIPRVDNPQGVGTTGMPWQRCHWYQIAKRSDVITNGTYRQMTVTTTTPLVDQTLLIGPTTPAFPNHAVFVPGVINVFSKTFYVR